MTMTQHCQSSARAGFALSTSNLYTIATAPAQTQTDADVKPLRLCTNHQKMIMIVIIRMPSQCAGEEACQGCFNNAVPVYTDTDDNAYADAERWAGAETCL